MLAWAAPTIQQCLSPLVQFAHKLISTVGLSFLVKLRSQQSSQRYLIKLVPPGFWVTTKVECCYFSPHNATTHLEFHLLASWLAKVAKFANYVILDQSYCACALAELVRNDEMARASSLTHWLGCLARTISDEGSDGSHSSVTIMIRLSEAGRGDTPFNGNISSPVIARWASRMT